MNALAGVLAAAGVLGVLVLAYVRRPPAPQAADASLRRRAGGDAVTALRDSERRLRTITDHVPAMISYIDHEERYRFANPLVGATFGVESGSVLGRTVREVRGDRAYAEAQPYLQRALHGERVQFEGSLDGPGGSMDYRSMMVPDVDADGVVRGVYAMSFDISDLKRAERDLQEQKERAQVTLDSIGDAVVTCDTELRVTFLNRVAEAMTGWSLPEARGRPLGDVVRLVDLASRRAALSPLAVAIRERRTVALQLDSALVSRDGREVPVEDTAAPIAGAGGDVVGGVMVFHDVSEARTMALRMSHLAQHDYLTDLPNRILLQDRLNQALAGVSRGMAGAVIFIDLDDFKTINDSLGHHAGDLVLQEVARRLAGAVRSDDTVSRQGGDEFVVLLVRLADPSDAARVAEKLQRAMREPIQVEGQALHVGLSMGISVFPQDAEDAHNLTRHADTALYHSKQSGRGRYSYFAPEMSRTAEKRLELEQALRLAIARNELFLAYQPKVDCRTGRICGTEALVRWRREDGTELLPSEFIPLAEDCGLVNAIDAWVLRQACLQNRAWQQAGAPAAPVAVNISLAWLDPDVLLSRVERVLEETGLAPECLEIEFTESQVLAASVRASGLVEGLRARRVRIALDDFGTGYSSLSYLVEQCFDTIKIDRSFVSKLPQDEKQAAVVQAIVAMSRALGASVVAEGVEHADQEAALLLQGCHQMQGYLYSRPVDPESLVALLRAGPLRKSRVAIAST